MSAGEDSDHHARVLDVFNTCDLDKSGTIDRAELGQVLQILDAKYWTDARVDGLFKAMDTGSDGLIQFSEMLEWLFDKPQHRLFKLVTAASGLPTAITVHKHAHVFALSGEEYIIPFCPTSDILSFIAEVKARIPGTSGKAVYIFQADGTQLQGSLKDCETGCHFSVISRPLPLEIKLSYRSWSTGYYFDGDDIVGWYESILICDEEEVWRLSTSLVHHSGWGTGYGRSGGWEHHADLSADKSTITLKLTPDKSGTKVVSLGVDSLMDRFRDGACVNDDASRLYEL